MRFLSLLLLCAYATGANACSSDKDCDHRCVNPGASGSCVTWAADTISEWSGQGAGIYKVSSDYAYSSTVYVQDGDGLHLYGEPFRFTKVTTSYNNPFSIFSKGMTLRWLNVHNTYSMGGRNNIKASGSGYDIKILNCLFDSQLPASRTDTPSGCLYIQGDINLDIYKSVFKDWKSDYSGAVINTLGTATIQESTFKGSSGQPAIRATGAVTIRESNFASNANGDITTTSDLDIVNTKISTVSGSPTSGTCANFGCTVAPYTGACTERASNKGLLCNDADGTVIGESDLPIINCDPNTQYISNEECVYYSTSCNAGYFLGSGSATTDKCEACPSGQYQDSNSYTGSTCSEYSTSCNAGYFLGSGSATTDKCEINKCICTNGQKVADGTACNTDGEEQCESCTSPYALDGTTCTTCVTGYHLDENNACVINQCVCPNGVAANGFSYPGNYAEKTCGSQSDLLAEHFVYSWDNWYTITSTCQAHCNNDAACLSVAANNGPPKNGGYGYCALCKTSSGGFTYTQDDSISTSIGWWGGSSVRPDYFRFYPKTSLCTVDEATVCSSCVDGWSGNTCETAVACTKGANGQACQNGYSASGTGGSCSCDCAMVKDPGFYSFCGNDGAAWSARYTGATTGESVDACRTSCNDDANCEGFTFRADDNNRCIICEAGASWEWVANSYYYAEQKSEVVYQYVSQTGSSTSDRTCAACAAGYHTTTDNADACAINQCTCAANGAGATGTACDADGSTEKCICNTGYHLEGDTCVANQCYCNGGVGVTTDGDNICMNQYDANNPEGPTTSYYYDDDNEQYYFDRQCTSCSAGAVLIDGDGTNGGGLGEKFCGCNVPDGFVANCNDGSGGAHCLPTSVDNPYYETSPDPYFFEYPVNDQTALQCVCDASRHLVADGAACVCASGYHLEGDACAINQCPVSAPANGALGDCVSPLADGATCVPTCNEGLMLSGINSCTTGTLTAAECIPYPSYPSDCLSGQVCGSRVCGTPANAIKCGWSGCDCNSVDPDCQRLKAAADGVCIEDCDQATYDAKPYGKREYCPCFQNFDITGLNYIKVKVNGASTYNSHANYATIAKVKTTYTNFQSEYNTGKAHPVSIDNVDASSGSFIFPIDCTKTEMEEFCLSTMNSCKVFEQSDEDFAVLHHELLKSNGDPINPVITNPNDINDIWWTAAEASTVYTNLLGLDENLDPLAPTVAWAPDDDDFMEDFDIPYDALVAAGTNTAADLATWQGGADAFDAGTLFECICTSAGVCL